MPIEEGTRRRDIVAQIADRVEQYNHGKRARTYDKAYAAFIGIRRSGMQRFGGLATWLCRRESAEAIYGLMATFGMNARSSRLVPVAVFARGAAGIPKVIDVDALARLRLYSGPLAHILGGSTAAAELAKLFAHLREPEQFTASGGFVIGTKVAHCVLPHVVPMIDISHIGESLCHVSGEDYAPPGDSWEVYIGHAPRGCPNPSPKGAGRNCWKADQVLCAIGFYARLYQDWQDAHGNPGPQAFLKVDKSATTTSVVRILDKALW